MQTFKKKILGLKTHSTDGLQSVPQWESAFNYPSGAKVRALILTLFDDIEKESFFYSWEYSMLSRLECSKQKEWNFIDPKIH